MNGICWASGSEIKARYDDISAKFQAGDPLVVETVDGLAELICSYRIAFQSTDQDDDHYKAEWQLAEYCAINKVIDVRPQNPAEQSYWYYSQSGIKKSPAEMVQAVYDDHIHRTTYGFERLAALQNTVLVDVRQCLNNLTPENTIAISFFSQKNLGKDRNFALFKT